MDACRAQRQSLTEEFKELQSFFVALGDETRQQIFIALLEYETVGMRVPEITRRTHLGNAGAGNHQTNPPFSPGSVSPLAHPKRCRVGHCTPPGDHELLLCGR